MEEIADDLNEEVGREVESNDASPAAEGQSSYEDSGTLRRRPPMQSGDRRYMPMRRPRPRGRLYYRKKVDKIQTQNLVVDYKRPDVLRRFVTEKGKILPKRITGTSAKNQRRLVREIKRARFLAMLPMG